MTEPANLELSIAGAICIDPRSLTAIRETGLSADDFSNTACSCLYDSAVEAADRGKTFDAVTLSEALVGVVDAPDRFIAECMEICPTAANAPLHAKLLHQKAVAARFRQALQTAIAEEEGTALASTVAGLSQAFLTKAEGKRFSPLSEACATVYRRLDAPTPEGRIDTGFSKLDRFLKGLWPGQLCIIGARPGVGKSAFALHLAATAAQSGKRVLFFSLEMTADEIAERLIARNSTATLDTLIDGTKDVQRVREIGDVCKSLSSLPLTICDQPDISIAQVRAKARMLPDLSMIIVDYLGLMQTQRRDNRNLELGELSRSLKNLASELKIPIVALSQLNRGTDETEQPSLRSLRDSGELEQDAGKIILLWNIDRTTDTVGVSVAKNRRGATGIVQMHFDGSHMRFYELESEYIPPKPKRIF